MHAIITSGFRMIQAPPSSPLASYLTWIPDPSPGVTGYNIGIRTSANPPGTYPLILAVEGQPTSLVLLSDINPPLSSGNYVGAVQSTFASGVGPWSAEFLFSVA